MPYYPHVALASPIREETEGNVVNLGEETHSYSSLFDLSLESGACELLISPSHQENLEKQH